MNTTLRKIVISLSAFLVAVALVVFIAQNPARVGNEPLFIRAALLSLAVVSGLIAAYPFNPLFSGRPGIYMATVCAPAIIPVLVYYFILLPNEAGVGLGGEQLDSQFISDDVASAINYPVYTPLLQLENLELFTKQANVFLRMTAKDGDEVLLRAVRKRVPGSGPNTEATVQAVLNKTDAYEFIPLDIPPVSSLTARLAFIMSNVESDSAFIDVLDHATVAQFELRDPENGRILLGFPLKRI